MTKQTNLSKREEIHIMDVSSMMIERLAYINVKPENIIICSELIAETIPLLQKIYPCAKVSVSHSEKANLIFAILDSNAKELTELLKQCKKNLASEGLLMLGLLNREIDICDVGDFLSYLGFVNVVMDKEIFSCGHCVIYAHAWASVPDKPVSIPLNQLRRRRLTDF